MNDMPERIFAWPYKQAHQGVSLAGGKPDEMREYRRADLRPTDEQIMAHPKVVALVEALTRIAGKKGKVVFCRDGHEECALIARNALRDLKGGE